MIRGQYVLRRFPVGATGLKRLVRCGSENQMIAQLDLTAFSVLGIPIALAVIGFFGWMIWRFFFND